VKALLTSLPLVSELHHPSMRERHWKQLMRATGRGLHSLTSELNLSTFGTHCSR